MAKTAREAMKAKAQRLGSSRPLEKVDSSTFTPPELLDADVKTGLRPISRRAFKKGGKVMGEACDARADRKPRKSGGKTEATEYANAKVNRNVKAANEERPGIKHVGGMARGGRKKMTSGEARQFFDRMYEQGDRDRQAKSEAALRTPEGEAGRQARNAAVAQAFRNKGDIDPSAMKKGGRAKKNAGGGNMPLPVPRPKNLDAEIEAREMAKQAKQANTMTSPEYRRELEERQNQMSPRKSGGRTKKASGGQTRAAQMMKSASDTAGVPGARMDFASGQSRFSKSLGMKKGGKAHEDVAADKALIRKMVKPSARKGRDDGGRLSESTRAAKASRDDYDASMASRRATENFLNSPDAEFDARLAMAESTRDNSRIMRKRAENIAKQTGYGSFTGDPMGRQDIDRLRNSPFIGTYRDHGSQTPSAYEEAMKRGGKAKRKGKEGGGAMGALGGIIPMLLSKGKKDGGRTARKEGGGVFSGAGYPHKISGVVPGGRTARAAGGKAKGKTNINIVIAAGRQQDGGQGMAPPPGLMGKPPGGIPVPVAPPPGAGGPQGGMPMPMPMPMPPGGPAGAPGAGGPPPLARKSGGRISKVASSYKDMEAGSGGGEGRLQKTDIAKKGKDAPAFKKGGKVYSSYKDMDAGAGSGKGRLEKTEIASRKH
jgi:hypothetical protein